MKTSIKYLLLIASCLLIIGCNNTKTKDNTKEVSKQELLDEPPKPGSIGYLIYKNGFKIFKLGEDIKNYSDIIKPFNKEKDMYIVTDTSLLYWDDIKLDLIALKTDNDFIDAIHVILKKTYSDKLFSKLISAYGEPDMYTEYTKSWHYKMPKLLLYCRIDKHKYKIFVTFNRDKNINYEKLKKIRQIERDAEKYVKGL